MSNNTTLSAVELAELAVVSEHIDEIRTAWLGTAASMVFSMQLGFLLFEVGMVDPMWTSTIVIKNIEDTFSGLLAFLMFGFSLTNTNQSWYGIIGGLDKSLLIGVPASLHEEAFLAATFATTTATIMSGAILERMKNKGYIVYCFLIVAFNYSFCAHWTWNTKGWLYKMDFHDTAGASVVHVTGGIGALIAAYLLGPREGSVDDKTGKLVKLKAAERPVLVAMGTLILWTGWVAFNVSSPLATVFPVEHSIYGVAMNSIVGPASACVSCFLIQHFYLEQDIMIEDIVSCALAGLVSITGNALTVEFWAAYLIGFFVSPLYFYTVYLEREVLMIDDPLAIGSVHLFPGIYSIIMEGIFASGRLDVKGLVYGGYRHFGIQVMGITVIVIFDILATLMIWYLMNRLIFYNTTLKVTALDNYLGIDMFRLNPILAFHTLLDGKTEKSRELLLAFHCHTMMNFCDEQLDFLVCVHNFRLLFDEMIENAEPIYTDLNLQLLNNNTNNHSNNSHINNMQFHDEMEPLDLGGGTIDRKRSSGKKSRKNLTAKLQNQESNVSRTHSGTFVDVDDNNDDDNDRDSSDEKSDRLKPDDHVIMMVTGDTDREDMSIDESSSMHPSVIRKHDSELPHNLAISINVSGSRTATATASIQDAKKKTPITPGTVSTLDVTAAAKTTVVVVDKEKLRKKLRQSESAGNSNSATGVRKKAKLTMARDKSNADKQTSPNVGAISAVKSGGGISTLSVAKPNSPRHKPLTNKEMMQRIGRMKSMASMKSEMTRDIFRAAITGGKKQSDALSQLLNRETIVWSEQEKIVDASIRAIIDTYIERKANKTVNISDMLRKQCLKYRDMCDDNGLLILDDTFFDACFSDVLKMLSDSFFKFLTWQTEEKKREKSMENNNNNHGFADSVISFGKISLANLFGGSGNAKNNDSGSDIRNSSKPNSPRASILLAGTDKSQFRFGTYAITKDWEVVWMDTPSVAYGSNSSLSPRGMANPDFASSKHGSNSPSNQSAGLFNVSGLMKNLNGKSTDWLQTREVKKKVPDVQDQSSDDKYGWGAALAAMQNNQSGQQTEKLIDFVIMRNGLPFGDYSLDHLMQKKDE